FSHTPPPIYIYPLSLHDALPILILIFTFFITSADSAMFVLGMMSENGNLNPTNVTKLTWGIIIGAVSAILIITGGLEGLQSALVAMAVPLAILLLSMCYSMYKELQQLKRQ